MNHYGAVSFTYPSLLDELDLGAPVSLTPVGGGCIADAAVVTFENGIKVFLKRSRDGQGRPPQDMFEREAEGLQVLAAADAIHVPRVLAVNEEALALELIQPAPKKRGFAEDFGRNFAALHACKGKTCGFAHDNYIGASRQFNEPLAGPWDAVAPDDGSSWPEFFLERRLRVQTRLAISKGYGDQLERLLDRAESRIIDLLAAAIEPSSLLHGDLWSGNFIVDEHGEACLIDPAAYFGHREADQAMTRLFGGFEPAFYAAYAEAAPLQSGHEDRLSIYQLYHILNHLNLFGRGYFERSRQILQYYAH